MIEEEITRESFYKYLKALNKTEISEFCAENKIPFEIDLSRPKKESIEKIMGYISPVKKKKPETRRSLYKKLKEEIKNVRLELIEYDKEDLKAFIKKEHLKVYITPRMGRAYILEAILEVVETKKKETIDKSLQKKSVFGHKVGTVQACLDEMLYDGSRIKEMVQEVLNKSFTDNEDIAHQIVTEHIQYLPPEKGIVLIVTMQPDPNNTQVVAMFGKTIVGANTGINFRGKKKII